ncbi:MAG: ATP-binding cassette domain-containing protein [Chloroflexota bacterium]
MNETAISVTGLTKVYPRVTAVNNISFTIRHGEIFGLLGPNGAGKTTTLRMLLTLTRPTSGRINILGIDALAQPSRVREVSGYVTQELSVDGELTGYENVLMYAKLYNLPSGERKGRIEELLRYLELEDRAGDLVKHYSGGMMRRLELAQALVNRPRMLFLDEPTIGLDPSARRVIWDHINKLREEMGTTVLITTHDMSEADALCDRLGIMDRGKLVTIGAPDELKSTVGGDVLTLTAKNPDLTSKLEALGYRAVGEAKDGHVNLFVSEGEKLIPQLLADLRTSGVEVEAVSLKKPTLDDVFLKYTGIRMEEGESFDQTRIARRTFRRLSQ